MTRRLRARALSSAFEPLTAVPDDPARTRLGVVRYADTSFNPVVKAGHPELTVHLAETGPGFAEVWTSAHTVESGEHKAIVYAHDGEYLFCAGRIPPCHEQGLEPGTGVTHLQATLLRDGHAVEFEGAAG